jgi:hypothetical protein
MPVPHPQFPLLYLDIPEVVRVPLGFFGICFSIAVLAVAVGQFSQCFALQNLHKFSS